MGLDGQIQTMMLPQRGKSVSSSFFSDQLLCRSQAAFFADQTQKSCGIISTFLLGKDVKLKHLLLKLIFKISHKRYSFLYSLFLWYSSIVA